MRPLPRTAAVACAVWCVLALVGVAKSETMRASWYGAESSAVTAYCVAGICRKFHPLGFTAAHRKLPFGTMLRLTYQGGKPVDVEVTDCGPYVAGRQLDVSLGTALAQGWKKHGVVDLQVEVLSLGSHNSRCG